jgi:IS5 family transposase
LTLFFVKLENFPRSFAPWSRLIALIEPAYPTTGRRGRQSMPLASMLRIHCMQNWFRFSDRQMEDALYEIESIRRFAGFGSVTEALSDETTILNFRHLLEKNQLTEKLLETINGYLKEQGLLVSQGTMVDATIIHVPSSTKNKDKSRDPDMHQTRKGQQWYFGMKIHIGADVNSGAVHTVTTTAANVADINELPKLLREGDQVIFADAGIAAMNTGVEPGIWACAGASMTSGNPAKICHPARRSATENSPRFEPEWSTFSG